MDENKDKIENEGSEELEKENDETLTEKKESQEDTKSDTKKDETEIKEPEKDELTLANEKIKEWEDKYKRLLAEFDNFRKRSEKESALMIDIGASMILTKILPVVDNFERALQNVPDEINGNSFVDGIDKIYKQIIKTFEDIGVKPIEAVGKPFDANLHNAVMTDENAEGEVDTIVEELQKGYTYKEQVLRHSMVKVKK